MSVDAYRNRFTFPLIPDVSQMLLRNIVITPESLIQYFPQYSRFERSQTSSGLYVCKESQPHEPYKQAVVAIMGPTAVGKNTIIKMLENQLSHEKYTRIITATTRLRRPDESPDDHLFLKSKEEFTEMRMKDLFIEVIHQHDHWYGTTTQQMQNAFDTHAPIIIWEGDVFGFTSLQKWLRENTDTPSVSIFLLPAMGILPYAKRIYDTRGTDRISKTKEFAFRFPKSMAELKRAAETVDSLILNSPSQNGIPTEAFETLMQYISENVKGI